MIKYWRYQFKYYGWSIAILMLCTLTSGPASAVDGANIRVVVSGDSISAGYYQPSYRMPFYNSLISNNCSVDMVGTQELTSYGFNRNLAGIDYPNLDTVDGHPSGAHWSSSTGDDTHHQAYGGMRADQIKNGVIATNPNREIKPIGDLIPILTPDFVLLHLGTNDLGQKLNSDNPPETQADVLKWAKQTKNDMIGIISDIQAQQANTTILIGNFIPREGENESVVKALLETQMSDTYRSVLTSAVNDLNDPRVQMVDVASGFDNSSMTSDGIHPNRAGEIHIANAFAAKVMSLTDCAEPNPLPQLLTPSESQSIIGSSTKVTWTKNGTPGITRWWVRAGKNSDGSRDLVNDYHNSGGIRNPLLSSWTVRNLPTDGSTVFISLWYYANEEWTLADINAYKNDKDNSDPVEPEIDTPQITSPATATVIKGTSAKIKWKSHDFPGITRWWVRAGKKSNASYNPNSDYYNSGSIRNPASNNWTIHGLPADGSKIYVSLWYYANGAWSLAEIKPYTNRKDSSTPVLVSPSTSDAIIGTSVSVSWNAKKLPGITHWWVRAGQYSNARYSVENDFYNSGSIQNNQTTSWTISGLPADGRTVYLSLWYYANGSWHLAEVNGYISKS